MYELWQTEWCPASRRIRELLTELGIDYVNRQVPVEKADRSLLLRRTGTDTIPVLVAPGGAALAGEEEIARYLAEHEAVPTGAEAHAARAERARRRYLEEECRCP